MCQNSNTKSIYGVWDGIKGVAGGILGGIGLGALADRYSIKGEGFFGKLGEIAGGFLTKTIGGKIVTIAKGIEGFTKGIINGEGIGKSLLRAGEVVLKQIGEIYTGGGKIVQGLIQGIQEGGRNLLQGKGIKEGLKGFWQGAAGAYGGQGIIAERIKGAAKCFSNGGDINQGLQEFVRGTADAYRGQYFLKKDIFSVVDFKEGVQGASKRFLEIYQGQGVLGEGIRECAKNLSNGGGMKKAFEGFVGGATQTYKRQDILGERIREVGKNISNGGDFKLGIQNFLRGVGEEFQRKSNLDESKVPKGRELFPHNFNIIDKIKSNQKEIIESYCKKFQESIKILKTKKCVFECCSACLGCNRREKVLENKRQREEKCNQNLCDQCKKTSQLEEQLSRNLKELFEIEKEMEKVNLNFSSGTGQRLKILRLKLEELKPKSDLIEEAIKIDGKKISICVA